MNQLVTHALKALASATPEGVELNIKNTTIAIVGKDTNFNILDEESARTYLDTFVMRPEDRVQEPQVEEPEDVHEPEDIEE